jgi:hypothetical protein
MSEETTAGTEGSVASRARGVVVGVGKALRAGPAELPPGMVYRDVNDPHWWKVELVHDPSGDVVFCRE